MPPTAVLVEGQIVILAPASTRSKREKPSGRSIPYLFTHRNSPAFRIRIPADLQDCLGKTEYRRSLGRCYASEAKFRALKLAAAAFEVFAFARGAVEARGGHLTRPGMEGNTSAGFGYTSTMKNREDIIVIHGESPVSDGSTETLHGRALGSLTDDEIRSIADAWLLQALKDTNLFRLHIAPYRASLLAESQFRQAAPQEVDAALLDLGAVCPEDVEGGSQGEAEEDANGDATAAARPSCIAVSDPAFIAAALDESLEAQAEREAKTAGSIKDFYLKALRTQQVTKAASTVDTALAQHGVSTDPATESAQGIASGGTPSLPYRLACQEMVKAKANFYGIMEPNAAGDYAPYDAAVQQLAPGPPVPPHQRVHNGRRSLAYLAQAL